MNRLGIVIVTFNSDHYLQILIPSISIQTYSNCKLYVIDNNSREESILKANEILINSKLSYEITSLYSNTGYAFANNIGAKAAIADGCDFVFIVNPDIELSQNCFKEIFKVFDKFPNAGVAGPLLFYGENKEANILEHYGLTINFKTQKKITQHVGKQFNSEMFDDFFKVDSINGSNIFVKAEVINKIGLFEESFFMYNEEIDFALRVKSAGYETYVCKNAKAWHHHVWDRSNYTGYAIMYYYMGRNRMLYFKKYNLLLFGFIDICRQLLLLPVLFINMHKDINYKIAGFYYMGIFHGIIGRNGKSELFN
jgi:GT2 family glycosyltransferase